LNAQVYKAIYPYPHTEISVYADPISHRSKEYLATRALLKDDWSYDVLELSAEAQADILRQLGEA
jgi:hypothetical protein